MDEKEVRKKERTQSRELLSKKKKGADESTQRKQWRETILENKIK